MFSFNNGVLNFTFNFLQFEFLRGVISFVGTIILIVVLGFIAVRLQDNGILKSEYYKEKAINSKYYEEKYMYLRFKDIKKFCKINPEGWVLEKNKFPKYKLKYDGYEVAIFMEYKDYKKYVKFLKKRKTYPDREEFGLIYLERVKKYVNKLSQSKLYSDKDFLESENGKVTQAILNSIGNDINRVIDKEFEVKIV